jgi:hypothetical protein
MLHSPWQSADDGSALPTLKELYDPCRRSLHTTGETCENAADAEIEKTGSYSWHAWALRSVLGRARAVCTARDLLRQPPQMKADRAAGSWAQPWRVIVKAEVMAAGDNPRFVVTSLEAPTPQQVYEDLYCARGNCENDIKAVKCDLHSDRTSATTFLANAMRLLLSCAAYVLHHALRTHTLAHTALATAQPATVILTLFKVATQIKQYKDRILLHLPTSCPVKALLSPRSRGSGSV